MLGIDPKHRIVEGVASDGHTIFVSSVLDRQILACTTTCRTFATLPAGLHPLGIAWDWSRQFIWVAADCPQLPGIAKCAKGALVAVNRAGEIVGSLAPRQEFHPGDVSVSLHAVFVSDSRSGLVYGLVPRRAGLRAVNRPGDGKSAQGTALAPDGTSVIVADYSHGIGRIDMKTTATSWLFREDGKLLRGIDGLVRCGEGYFGIYNGSAPGRVLSISLRGSGIEVREVVPGLELYDPTQIAFDGKRLLIVSNSGWETAGKLGSTRKDGAKIIEIRLPDGCRR
ncbi:MAG: hypothetical protein ACJ8E0_10800 [Sphingomicrobium sp.]